MDYSEAKRLAEERANLIAPAPKTGPIGGAFFAGMGSLGVLGLFSILLGLESDRAAWTVIVVVGIFSGGTYWVLNAQLNKHFKVFAEEMQRLHQEDRC